MSPVLITLIAVFIGTAALCAGVGLTVLSKSEDPLARLDKLNRRFMPAKESSGILKKELVEESLAGLHEVWERIGIGPGDIRAWIRQAELPVRVWVLFAIGGMAGLGLVIGATRLHVPTH